MVLKLCILSGYPLGLHCFLTLELISSIDRSTAYTRSVAAAAITVVFLWIATHLYDILLLLTSYDMTYRWQIIVWNFDFHIINPLIAMTSNEDAFASVFDKIYQNAQFGTSIMFTKVNNGLINLSHTRSYNRGKHSRHHRENQVTQQLWNPP